MARLGDTAHCDSDGPSHPAVCSDDTTKILGHCASFIEAEETSPVADETIEVVVPGALYL